MTQRARCARCAGGTLMSNPYAVQAMIPTAGGARKAVRLVCAIAKTSTSTGTLRCCWCRAAVGVCRPSAVAASGSRFAASLEHSSLTHVPPLDNAVVAETTGAHGTYILTLVGGATNVSSAPFLWVKALACRAPHTLTRACQTSHEHRPAQT